MTDTGSGRMDVRNLHSSGAAEEVAANGELKARPNSPSHTRSRAVNSTVGDFGTVREAPYFPGGQNTIQRPIA